MYKFVFNGTSGGYQGLRGNLPTKGAKPIFVGMVAPKDIDFDRLKIEQGNQVFQCSTHPSSLANPPPKFCPIIGRFGHTWYLN